MSKERSNNQLSPRHYALNVFSDVLVSHSYCNLRLKELRPLLNDTDYRFACALVYTALDRLLYLDHVLEGYVKKTPKPLVRNILRLGVTELLFLRTPPHAAVSEYVSLCAETGRAELRGFVNAVLRRIDRERDALPPLPDDTVEQLSVQYSCPAWIVSMWIGMYGRDGASALLSSGTPGTTLRAQYPFTSDQLQAELPVPTHRGIYDSNALIAEKGFDFTGSSVFQEGKMAIQSEGSMLICRAAGDCSGKKVLDACSAPGGKAAYLSSLSKNNLDLTCFEIHRHRVDLTKKTLSRLHVSGTVEERDASIPDARFDEVFDLVLLDVPCSGFGMFHEKPDLRYAKSESDLTALADLQRKILDTCSRYVRPGGILLYATCTITRTENEDQVLAFLDRHRDFTPDRLPFAKGSMLQLLPHIHGTDGFFMARMKRCI